MRRRYLDLLSTAFMIVGGLAMFARLSSHNWLITSSWKGTLGILGVLGLMIMLTHARELIALNSVGAMTEFFLWLITGTVVIASLLSNTTKAEFIVSGALIGLSWLVQVGEDVWQTSHTHNLRTHHNVV